MAKLHVGLLVLGLVVVCSASGAPTDQSDGVNVKKLCVDKFASAGAKFEMPKPVQRLVDESTAKYPVEKFVWNDLKSEDTQQFVDIYPIDSCDNYPKLVGEVFGDLLKTDCGTLMEEDDEALEMAMKNNILRPILLGKEACFFFEPELTTQGLHV